MRRRSERGLGARAMRALLTRRVALASCRHAQLHHFHSAAVCNDSQDAPKPTKLKAVQTQKSYAELPAVRLLPDGTPAAPLAKFDGGLRASPRVKPGRTELGSMYALFLNNCSSCSGGSHARGSRVCGQAEAGETQERQDTRGRVYTHERHAARGQGDARGDGVRVRQAQVHSQAQGRRCRCRPSRSGSVSLSLLLNDLPADTDHRGRGCSQARWPPRGRRPRQPRPLPALHPPHPGRAVLRGNPPPSLLALP
jgi:hypothetical protein